MINSEVRAHLRKGELAVSVLETLGYRFDTDPANTNRTIWIAPVDPTDALKDALQALIKAGIEHGVKGQMEAFEADSTKGPNWHLVKDQVGRLFRIRPENIPQLHPLRNFGDNHFRGVNYQAISIQYERSSHYTGYTVSFHFKTRPYTPEVVRLPLSCCAFQ